MLAIFVLPLIGAVLMVVLSSIWYGPLFSKAYMSAMGINPALVGESNKKGMIVNTLLEFLMSYIMLFGFLTLMNIAYAGTFSAAVTFGALFWFFIVMPQKASGAIWSGRDSKSSWTLFGLGAGISLISFVLIAPVFIWLIKFFI